MIKNKRYVCIEEFEVPILDEEGTVLNEDGNYYGAIPIKKGSQWSLDGTDTLCGADLKLTNETNFIEISNERLENCFIKIIDKPELFCDSDGYPEAIIIPKSILESEVMKEAFKYFSKYMLENEDDPDSYFLDNKYSETGIKWAMFDGDMAEVITDIEKETLYKVWQVKINEYPF